MAKSPSNLSLRMTTAISANSSNVRKGQHEAGTPFKIRRIDAGTLVLPTGRICVADAYSADEFPALNRIVPPGEYAVEIFVAMLPKDLPFGNERGAFVVVTFSDEPVASWKPVTAVASAPPCFTDERPSSFVQCGATGIFSPEAGEVHYAELYERFDDRIREIRSHAKRFGSNDWMNYRPTPDSANVVICEGGWGDGNYKCVIGLNEFGRLARASDRLRHRGIDLSHG